MYQDKETKISFQYLSTVINALEEPICLLGGWAVYFLVNPLFEKEKGHPYLGSRDIDLGFNDFKIMKKVMNELEKLGFKQVSFRFYKEVHSETMKELSKEEARKTPLHFIFPMYVDLIVLKTSKTLKTKIGFAPIDEPLLKPVFEGQKTVINNFNKRVFIPTPSLLIAMKIFSIKGRNKEHKKIKDLCDIITLFLYSGIDIKQLKSEIEKFVSREKISKNLIDLGKVELEKASAILGISQEVILQLVETIKK